MNGKPREGEFRIGSEGDIVMAPQSRSQRRHGLGLWHHRRDAHRHRRFGTDPEHLPLRRVRRHALAVAQRSGSGGLELIFEDHGPGIPDVEKAMEAGFSTGKGLGLGLPGAKRLMDEMTVQSRWAKGTTVEVRKWLRK